MSSTSTGFDLRSDPVAMVCDSFDMRRVRCPGGSWMAVGLAADKGGV
jgi:hypothetical protein